MRIPVRDGYERKYGGEEIRRGRRQVPLLDSNCEAGISAGWSGCGDTGDRGRGVGVADTGSDAEDTDGRSGGDNVWARSSASLSGKFITVGRCKCWRLVDTGG